MLPSLTPVVCAGDYCAYPMVQREASSCRCLTREELRSFVVTDVIVIVYYRSDGGVKYGEQAEGCSHAIGTVPERWCS